MKNLYKNFIFKLIIVFTLLNAGHSYSQCGMTYNYGLLVPSSGTNFVTYTGISPYTYYELPFLTGANYAVSSCGSSIATEFTLFNSSNNYTGLYTADSGPFCTGTGSFTYTPNFTGLAKMQVSQYQYCGWYNGFASAVVNVRQNDNLAITSASAVCSGKTITLTATPAPLGSVPNANYGDAGTFAGANVTTTLFSAPTVTAVTVYTVSYKYGWVTHTQSITVYPNPTVSVSGGTICSGNTFTLNGSGASTYTYSSGSPVVSPNVTTNYSVTGTSTAGCISASAAVAMVSVNTTPTLAVNSATICSGNSVLISPSGADTYSITGGSFNVIPNTTTSYSVTGTASNGCIASNTAVSTISVNTTPTITVNSATICSGNSVLISPGGADTYTITGGSFNVNPNATTSYSVSGTATNGCAASNTAVSTISVNTTPTLAVNNATICSGNSALISPSGADTYTISGGSFNVSPNTTTSYTVTGMATNGCIAANTVVSTVSVNTTPTLAVNSATICSGNSVLISPSGADTYTITGGSFNVSPNITTTYSVTGMAANGCAASNTAVSTISVNTTPTLAVNSATICSGNSVLISPTGADTYTITGGSFNVSPNTTTSYTVTGTAANGCAASNTVASTVSVNTTPTLGVNSATICSGTSVSLIPTGANSYTITGSNFTVSPNTTTSYSITGTAANGCVASNTAVSTVSVNTTPTLAVNSATICSGYSVAILPSGANTYTITGGSFTVSPNTTTSYTVTGTAGNGCAAANAVVSSVSVNTTPTLSVNNATICSGNSTAIVPSGAGTYTITGNTFTVSPGTTTSYTVTGTALNGCAASNTVVSTILVNTTPTLGVNSATICSGNSVSILPTGADTYTITGGNFTVSPNTTTSYSVTGTATNGCIAANTAVSTVSVNTTPTVVLNGGVICQGNSFTFTPGGASTYTISGNNFTITPAATDSYSLTGTSAEGCQSFNTAVATVSVVNTLSIVVAGNTSICNGSAATLTASGAATYSWNTGVTTDSITLSPTATTDYTVIGSSGTCSNSTVVNLIVNQLPVVTVNSGTICSGSEFVIVPAGASTYSISGNSFTVNPTANSSYSLTGTDGNGCVSSEVVSNVAVNALPVVTAATSQSVVCIDNSATLTAVGATSYSWSTSQTDSVITVTSAISGTETYTVSGTDANGCVNTATVIQKYDNCTGLEKGNAGGVNIAVYPNPNNGRFTIETVGNSTIEVMNAVGQVVYTGTSNGKIVVSMEHLTNGIYFVKVTTNTSQQVARIIKE
ncbi:hypothetical protein CNR22_04050 [Sphingobacteriaceae bacterium]|nr:hypothetical protein CNR22_04050 [Sphingobacteriaceae bacterium]